MTLSWAEWYYLKIIPRLSQGIKPVRQYCRQNPRDEVAKWPPARFGPSAMRLVHALASRAFQQKNPVGVGPLTRVQAPLQLSVFPVSAKSASNSGNLLDFLGAGPYPNKSLRDGSPPF